MDRRKTDRGFRTSIPTPFSYAAIREFRVPGEDYRVCPPTIPRGPATSAQVIVCADILCCVTVFPLSRDFENVERDRRLSVVAEESTLRSFSRGFATPRVSDQEKDWSLPETIPEIRGPPRVHAHARAAVPSRILSESRNRATGSNVTTGRIPDRRSLDSISNRSTNSDPREKQKERKGTRRTREPSDST